MRNYIEQIIGLWRQFGASQKFMLMLSLAAIGAVVAGLLVWSSQPKMQLLYGKMDTKDMSEVVGVLESHGVPYKVGGGGSSIFVPADKVYSMRMELASSGVPSGGGVGFEIFDETNFGVSDFVQKTNYMRAIQGELSRTVSQMKGVRSARVMVSVPENRLLAEQARIKATGSVFVDTGGNVLNESAVNSIRFLVANSVEGLNVDEVAVVDNHGNVLTEGLQGGGMFGGGAGGFRFRQGMEDYYTKKIQGMLEPIVGFGQVVARVAVKVDTDTKTLVEERYDPTGQVVRSQTVTEDNSTKDDSAPRQVAGVMNQGGDGEFGAVNQQVSSSKDTTKKKVISYEISKSTIETVKGPGTVQEISAAVFIAMRMKQNGEGEELVESPRSEDEIKMIRNMIANAVGAISADETKTNITVHEVPFAKKEVVQTAGLSDSLFEMADLAGRFGSIGLALLMFLIFFRMLKKHRPSTGVVELLEGGSRGVGSAKDVTPKPTAELINELIQQKPDNVGLALKNWVNDDANK